MGQVSICIYLKKAQNHVLYAYDNYEIYFQDAPKKSGWFLIDGEKIEVTDPVKIRCSHCSRIYQEQRKRVLILCSRFRSVDGYQKVPTIQYIGQIQQTKRESDHCYWYVARERHSEYSNIVTDHRQVRKDTIFLTEGMNIWVNGLWILQNWQGRSQCPFCQQENERTCTRELVYPVQEKIIL